jgi:hypothetical protein
MFSCENAFSQNATWLGRRASADRTPDQPLHKDAMLLARNSGELCMAHLKEL